MAKKQPKRTLNPADHALSVAEHAVYKILSRRHTSGLTTTSGDVAAAWGGKNRSYTYKVISRLIEKKLAERYGRHFYRLTKEGKNA